MHSRPAKVANLSVRQIRQGAPSHLPSDAAANKGPWIPESDSLRDDIAGIQDDDALRKLPALS